MPDSTSEKYDSDAREPGGAGDRAHRRRAWLWAAVAVAGTVVLVAAIAVAVMPSRRSLTSQTGPSPLPSVPAEAPPAGRPGFGLPATDMFGMRLETPADPAGSALPQDATRRPDPARADYVSAAPGGVMWQRGWGGAALPFSASDGPAQVRDGIASGFAPTPQGAGLAAYDALARALAAPDGVWQRVIAQRYTSGAAALTARYARSRAANPDAARYVVVPEGFRVDEFTPAGFAVVRIAVRDRTGTAYTTWPVAWTGGDWRVRTPDDVEDLWAPAVPVRASEPSFGVWR